MHWRSKLIHPAARAPRRISLPGRHHLSGLDGALRAAGRFGRRLASERGRLHLWPLWYAHRPQLGARIAELEGARHSFVVPGGQAAIALIYFAFCKSGSHALVPNCSLWPKPRTPDSLLKGLNIEVEA